MNEQAGEGSAGKLPVVECRYWMGVCDEHEECQPSLSPATPEQCE